MTRKKKRPNPVIASLARQERVAKQAANKAAEDNWTLEFPQEVSNPPKEGEKMSNTVRNIILIVIAGILALCLFVSAIGLFGYAFVSGRTVVNQPEFNSSPLIDTSDQEIYSKPMNEGCFKLGGLVMYCQTGKPNEVTYTGKIGEGETLVYIAYTVIDQGNTYSNGVVAIIEGPYDLDQTPLTLRDGAATLVNNGEAVQVKLDSVWVDICRGDKRADGLWWSYQPWAYSLSMVGNYFFPTPGTVCFTEFEDTYPSFLTRPSTAPSEPTQAPAANERVTTGVTGTLSFPNGASVCGEEIVINGQTYTGCVTNAPAGTVKNGVIWPWDTELVNPLDLSK